MGRPALLALLAAALLTAGCGGGDSGASSSGAAPAPRGPADAKLHEPWLLILALHVGHDAHAHHLGRGLETRLHLLQRIVLRDEARGAQIVEAREQLVDAFGVGVGTQVALVPPAFSLTREGPLALRLVLDLDVARQPITTSPKNSLLRNAQGSLSRASVSVLGTT